METRIVYRSKSKAVRYFGYPDMHIPDQDEEAVAVAEAAQREFRPDYSIVGNDLLQATPFSRFGNQTIKEAVGEDFQETELNPANAHIDRVQKYTKIETIFQEGNHDAHIERWAAQHSKGSMSIFSLISPEANLSKGRKNFRYVKQGEAVQLHPNLICVHGWSYSVHCAAAHRRKSPLQSVVFNHAHRRQSDTLTYPSAEMPTEAMCAGCLCHRMPMYKHDGNPTGWTHGFWVAYVGKQDFTIYSVPINKGRAILPNGKEIKII